MIESYLHLSLLLNLF